MKRHSSKLVEIVAAFYVNSFILMRPILANYSYLSTIILIAEIVVLLVIYFFGLAFKLNGRICFKLNPKRCFKILLLFGFVSFVFLFDYFFRRTSYTWNYYYYFLIYSGLLAIWFINVRDFRIVLKYWTIFAITGGCLVMMDPFNSYAISGDYMSFGSAILPAFAATMIVFTFYKIRIILPLASVFLLEIFLYANKGASLTAISLILFFVIYLTENRKEKIKRVIIILAASLIFLLFAKQILMGLFDLAQKLGVDSYSLRGVEQFFESSELESFSARSSIWKNILGEFKLHFLVGMGIGGFQEIYGSYAHNFFLDIFITHGFILGFGIIIAIVLFIKKTLFYKDRAKLVFTTVVLLLWFIPMQVSFTYWTEIYFWTFIVISIL